MQRVIGSFHLVALIAASAMALMPTPSVAEMSVYTVNYPVAYFAERIGGDAVTVHFPAPPGIDPALWMPDPEVIGAYQAADLILLNGAGYAKWIDQASLPRRKLVDTSRSFRDAYLPGEETPVHQHGPAGEHTHGQIAFTTWLDPKQAIEQARSIEAAFVKQDAEHSASFARGANALVADLEELDRDLKVAFTTIEGEALIASHPVYSYLARRYGLDLRSLTWEPDADPGESGWQGLDSLLGERPARWMLWEARPLDSTAAKLEARGVGVVVFDVAANRPDVGDFLSMMRTNLEALNRALGLQ